MKKLISLLALALVASYFIAGCSQPEASGDAGAATAGADKGAADKGADAKTEEGK